MTTEQKLREALADVIAQLWGRPKSCGHEYDCICPGDKARAALALPQSETREEWLVAYRFTASYAKEQHSKGWASIAFRDKAESLDRKSEIDEHDHIASSCIESRTVSASPWVPVETVLPTEKP